MTTALTNAANAFLKLDEKDHCLLSQLLFLVPFAAWLNIMNFLGATELVNVFSLKVNFALVCYATMACFAVREVLFGKWDRTTLMGAALFGFMFAMAMRGGNPAVATACVAVFCARNVPFRRIAWVSFVSVMVFIIVTVTCWAVGFLPDITIMRGAKVRHNMGFPHPNAVSCYLFFALCLWVYLRGRKFFVVDFLVSVALFAASFYFTDGRTSFVLGIALAALALLLRFIPEKVLKHPAIPTIAVACIVLCAAVAIGASVFYDPSVSWMKQLNTLASGRFALAQQGIAQSGITLLANNVDLVRGTIVDCGFMRLLLNFGWLYTLIVVVLACCACIKAWRSSNWYLVIIAILIAVHGTTESCLYMLTFNQLLFLVGGLFYAGYDGFLPVQKKDTAAVGDAPANTQV